MFSLDLRADERVGLFIDAANMDRALQQLGWPIDYMSLRSVFAKKCNLIRAYYYSAYDGEWRDNSSRKLLDMLAYNGYTVVAKPVREIRDAATGNVARKGNLDVEIAVDMMRTASWLDHLVLFSGDGDFRPLVAALKQMGKLVTLVSTLKTPARVTSDDLRKEADFFVDLADLKPHVERAARLETA